MPVAGEIRAIEVAAVVVPLGIHRRGLDIHHRGLGIHHRGLDTWNIPPTTDTGRDVDCRFCLDSLGNKRGVIKNSAVESKQEILRQINVGKPGGGSNIDGLRNAVEHFQKHLKMIMNEGDK